MITKHEIERSILSDQSFSDLIGNTENARTLDEKEVEVVFAENLTILEGNRGNGVSVKAKDGQLVVTVSERSSDEVPP